MVVGVGSVWAQSDYSTTYTSNVTFSSSSKVIININNVEYDGIKAGTSKTAGSTTITLPAETKYLHFHAVGWKGETVTLTMNYNGNDFSTVELNSDENVSGSGTTYTLDNTNCSTKYYYRVTFPTALTESKEFTFTATTATSGKRFVLFGINTEKESDQNREECGLAWSGESASVTYGDSYTLPTLSNPNSLDVTYSSSNEAVATIDENGVVTVNNKTGNTTITASFAGNTTYKPGEASYTLNVTKLITPPKNGESETITFSKLYTANTPLDGEDVAGDNFTVTFNKGTGSTAPQYYTTGTAVRAYAKNSFTVKSDYDFSKVEISFGSSDGSNAISTDKGSYEEDGDCGVWTGGANEVTFTIGGTSGNRRITAIKITYGAEGGTGADAEFSFGETTSFTVGVNADFTAPTLTTADGYDGTVVYSSSDEEIAMVDEKTGEVVIGEKEGTATITAQADATENFKAGSASYTITVVDNRAECGLVWSTTEVNIELNAADYASLLPTLTNPNDLTLTYTSTDENVALYDGTVWVIETNAVGTSVITAEFAGNAQFKAGSASVTINVYDPNAKGTVNNPYTVAEALDATPASGNSEEVYVKGIVSGFYGTNTTITSDSYHRYYISDDGTNSNQLLVFNGKGLDGAAFSSADDLLENDEVVVKGQLTTYNGVKEINKDNVIVSLKRVEKNKPELAFSASEVTLTMGDKFTAPTLSFADGFNGTVSFESSDNDVATVDENGVVTIVGVGTTTITASFAGDDDWYADDASYTITVKKAITIEDGVFDFTLGFDYGSGQKSGTVAENVRTWKAGNVTLNVAGRNAWYNATDFRLYKATTTAAAGSMTFSVPEGKVITEVKFDKTPAVVADNGDYKEGTWLGFAPSVKFTHNSSGAVTIETVTVTYVDATDVDITIGDSEYTSVYYSGVALEVPTGVTAHTYKVNGANKLELSQTWNAGDVIAKGTAVVLHGAAGDYKMAISNEEGTTDTESVLKGFDAAGTTTGGTVYYRLTTKNNVPSTIGFYWGAENGGAFTVGAHKAYVAVDTQLNFGSGARMADIFGEETTGISDLRNAEMSREAYDLQGRQLSNSQLSNGSIRKGLYIVNGKKVVRK